VAIVDAARWGTTVAMAAAGRVTDTAFQAPDLAAVTAAVGATLLASLPAALPDVLRALDERAALDLDVLHLMAALPALVRAVRYGDVRGSSTAALSRSSTPWSSGSAPGCPPRSAAWPMRRRRSCGVS